MTQGAGPLIEVLKTRQAPRAGSGRRGEVAEIADKCVHCGLCNAVCPTYAIEGDERDGPRGRITLIDEMFARVGKKSGSVPSETERRHIGRCLSCMACVTACPAGVDYAHLIQHAKAHVRENVLASARERFLHWFATRVAPFPDRLRWLVKMAPVASRFGKALRLARVRELATLAEAAPFSSGDRAAFAGPGTAATTRERRGRVILLAGCVQQVLRPTINDATIRLLARSGIDVEVAAGAGCCGAVAGGTGDTETARSFARTNIDAWLKALAKEPAEAILFNAADCGAAVKDYPHLLRDDPEYAEKAAVIAKLARDVMEYLGERRLGPPRRWSSLKIAYQAACRLVHGQGVVSEPEDLIYEAGFTVIELADDGMCCGACDGYPFREPEIAEALRDRKVNHVLSHRPDVIATGSIACLNHMERGIGIPIVHSVELLDWAYGGPVPRGLEALSGYVTDVPGPPPLEVDDFIRS